MDSLKTYEDYQKVLQIKPLIIVPCPGHVTCHHRITQTCTSDTGMAFQLTVGKCSNHFPMKKLTNHQYKDSEPIVTGQSCNAALAKH